MRVLIHNTKWTFVCIPILVFLYYYFAYFVNRSDFLQLISVWTLLFIITYILLEKCKVNFWLLAIVALLVRLLFIDVTPNLSQDFYRFIWDGRLLWNGYNPYLTLPVDWMTQGVLPIAEAETLYKGMGPMNAGHYTNYPPVSQFIFGIAALIDQSSITNAMIVIRTLLIIADIGTLWIGYKLLLTLNLPAKRIFLFVLNPFIVIELTGNLHFEGVMVFFLLAGLYYLYQKKWVLSGVLIGVSIAVKLIPLLLLPVFIQYLTANRTVFRDYKNLRFTIPMVFYSTVLLTVFISFLPFLSKQFVSNFTASINLWFQTFEFNASIYYILRWIGYQIKGWNLIETLGPTLSFCGLLWILTISLIRNNLKFIKLLTGLLFSIFIYYLFATTVHPWYLTVPLALSVFTRYRFMLLWSYCIILSYTAYTSTIYKENLYLVFLEYSIVVVFLSWEIIKYNRILNKNAKAF